MASKSVADGAIWFNKDKKTIEVYQNGAWEKFAGALNDATWAQNKLTITKHDGTSIELDFSNVASIPALEAALNSLESKLVGASTDSADKDTIYGAKAAAAAAKVIAEQGVADAATAQGVADGAAAKATANETAIANEKTRAEGAEDRIEAAVGLNADGSHKQTTGNYTSEASSITGEIAALDTKLKEVADSVAGIAGGSLSEINAKLSTLESGVQDNKDAIDAVELAIEGMDANIEVTGNAHVNGTLVQENGKVTGFTIVETNVASADTLSNYMTTNDQALANVKATAEAALPTATFNEYKTTNDAEVQRVADIVDTFFEDALKDTDVEQYKDTLKELQDYITSDTTAAGQMAANIQANTEAIGVKASEGVEASGLYKEIADGDAVVDAKVSALAGRVETLENSTAVSELEARVSTNETDIAAIEKVISGYTTEGAVKSAVDAAQAAATAAGTAAATAQTTAESKVASVTSADDYIIVDNTDDKNPKVSVLAEAPSATATGLAKAKDVYDAMSWVEFE